MSEMKRVGFIGLGIMGLPMARNIAEAGFELAVVRGHAGEAVAELTGAGAAAFDTPAALAAEADAVLLCLPDTPDVAEVVQGEGGLLSGAKAGLVVVDHSTISPAVSRDLAKACAEKEVSFIDAPVSGGEEGAIAGTLSIMAGGESEALDRVRPALEAEGKQIVHVGGSGAGQLTKCCNQLIIAGTWQAIAEGMSLGVKAGVDPARMLEAVAGGAARSWALEFRMPRILKGNFKAGFMAKLHLKDLEIAREAARELGVPMPLSGVATAFYTALVARGGGEMDTSAMVTVQEDLAGVAIRSEAGD
jgi:3-hydroxyisobutyrate dehydrogenase-like beta-hydroxyacid dehydrogenase